MTSLLLIEDDAPTAAQITNLLASRVSVQTAATVDEGTAAVEEQRFAGLIVDLGLPDGSGLYVLGAARERDPRVPAAVLTGASDHESIESAALMGAFFLPKPVSPATLLKVVDGWLAERDRLKRVHAAWVERYALTPREADVLLTAATHGSERVELAAKLEIALSTVNSHARRILEKIDGNGLGDIVQRMLREALGD